MRTPRLGCDHFPKVAQLGRGRGGRQPKWRSSQARLQNPHKHPSASQEAQEAAGGRRMGGTCRRSRPRDAAGQGEHWAAASCLRSLASQLQSARELAVLGGRSASYATLPLLLRAFEENEFQWISVPWRQRMLLEWRSIHKDGGVGWTFLIQGSGQRALSQRPLVGMLFFPPYRFRKTSTCNSWRERLLKGNSARGNQAAAWAWNYLEYPWLNYSCWIQFLKMLSFRTFAPISLKELLVHFSRLLPTSRTLTPLITCLWCKAPLTSCCSPRDEKAGILNSVPSPWYSFGRKLSYRGNDMSWEAPLVPWVCQGGSDQGSFQECRSRYTKERAFVFERLWWRSAGQIWNHPGGEDAPTTGQAGHCAKFRAMAQVAQSLVFQGLESWLRFFQLHSNTPAREKSTLAHSFIYSPLLWLPKGLYECCVTLALWALEEWFGNQQPFPLSKF